MVINCWSSYEAGSSGTGLDAADDGDYFGAIARCDISWLTNVLGGMHPQFTGKARKTDHDLFAICEEICGPERRNFDFSRERCENFNLKRHAPGEVRPSLAEEWEMHRRLGADHKLKDARLLPLGNQVGCCYTRIDRAVSFSIEHIRTLSLSQAEAICQSLKDRHAASAPCILGQYVARIDRVGVSCVDKEIADEISKMKNEKMKRSKYLEAHPLNELFLSACQ